MGGGRGSGLSIVPARQYGLLGLAEGPRLGLRSGRNGGRAGSASPDMGGPPNGVTASVAVVFVSPGLRLAHNMAPIVTTAAAIAIENVLGRGFGGVMSKLGAHGKMMGGRGEGHGSGMIYCTGAAGASIRHRMFTVVGCFVTLVQYAAV